jgi:hypothetical protein
MDTNLDDLLAEENKSELRKYVHQIAAAYSTKLVFDLIEAYERPFSRVVEKVEVDHGECRRNLTIDWRLPTLEEALPDHRHVNDDRFIARFKELNPVLAVPVYLMRKGRLMNNFVAESSAGEDLYICGQDEWGERMRLMLSSIWTLVDEAPCGHGHRPHLVTRARDEFYGLPLKSSDDAPAIVNSVVDKLKHSGVLLIPGLLERIRYIGRYVAKRHIIWLHLPCLPGDGTRLTLSYRTRFTAEYSPRRSASADPAKSHRYRRTLDRVRRIVGQEPYEFAVPLSMNSLCRSYHFHMPAPAATYFTAQRFILEKNLYHSETEQARSFRKYYRVNGAYVGGKDEAGGPVAHLYARELPATVGDQLYAYTRVRERPPGTTALVMWLCLLAAGFLWFYYMTWQRLMVSDTHGIDVAALFVALPGIASIWFSRAFRDDVRPRVPLVSRLGLVLVGFSGFYSLLAILVRRGICQEANACPGLLTTVFSQLLLLIFACALTGMSGWLIVRRISFHRDYQKLQNNVIDRYLR